MQGGAADAIFNHREFFEASGVERGKRSSNPVVTARVANAPNVELTTLLDKNV